MARPINAKQDQMTIALVDLYHVARIALDDPSRHARLCYAARKYADANPNVNRTAAYLAADRATSHD